MLAQIKTSCVILILIKPEKTSFDRVQPLSNIIEVLNLSLLSLSDLCFFYINKKEPFVSESQVLAVYIFSTNDTKKLIKIVITLCVIIKHYTLCVRACVQIVTK